MEVKECCGCGACANICPKRCISMKADNEGFLYPEIDKETCISCGLCQKVCPFIHTARMIDEPQVLAARSTSDQTRFISSSGGIFPEMARAVFQEHGIVVGAAMSPDNRSVVIKYIDHESDLEQLQGSKYIQAETGTIYNDVKQFLLNGQIVLFSGTTCQVAGLKSYLGKDYDNLICVDVICHGVPSPLMWNKYCNYIASKYGRNIDSVDFRSKKFSWRDFGVHLSAGKHIFEFAFQNPYFRMFNSNLCLRPSCYNCKVKGLKNTSDISIGDFWNIENVIPEFDDGRGVSIVLLNTEKGKNFFMQCTSERGIEVSPEFVSYTQACSCNPAIVKSMDESEKRQEFFSDLAMHEFKFIKDKYAPDSWKVTMKSNLMKIGIWPLVQKLRGGQ